MDEIIVAQMTLISVKEQQELPIVKFIELLKDSIAYGVRFKGWTTNKENG